MVYALIGLQLSELVRENPLSIVPIDIPVCGFIVCELVAEHFDGFLDHAVPAFARTK